MPTGNLLEEFLVGIGFKVDETGFTRLRASVGAAKLEATSLAKEIGGIGLATVGMAVTVGAAVLKVNESLSSLYYASQRTGVSASHLREMGQAVRQIGLTSGDVTGQLESLGRAFRSNPLLAANFRGMFGTDKPDEILVRVAKRYRDFVQQYGQLSQEAAIFLNSVSKLIDPALVAQIAANYDTYVEAATKVRKIYQSLGFSGRDFDAATGRAAKAVRDWNTVVIQLTAIWDRLVESLTPALTTTLQEFSNWLGEHHQDVEDVADSWARWLNEDHSEGLRKLRDGLHDLLTVAAALARTARWFVEHPDWAAAVGGALVGGRIFGVPGALVAGGAALVATRSAMGKQPIPGVTLPQDPHAPGAAITLPGVSADLRHPMFATQQPGDAAFAPIPGGQPVEADPLRGIKNYFQERQRIWREGLEREGVVPRFARGGIVPINAHAGEMVLPVNVSQGLQSFFGGGGNNPLRDLQQWVRGAAGFRPRVQIEGLQRFLEGRAESLTGGAGGLGASGTGGLSASGTVVPRVGFAGRMPGRASLSGAVGDRVRGGGQVAKGTGFSYGMLKKLAMDAGFPEGDASVMAAISMGESSGNPFAKKVDSVEASYGLTQINARAHPGGEQAYGDPVYAMRKAYELYQNRKKRGQSGFEDWSVYTSGAYKAHLDHAMRAEPQPYPSGTPGPDRAGFLGVRPPAEKDAAVFPSERSKPITWRHGDPAEWGKDPNSYGPGSPWGTVRRDAERSKLPPGVRLNSKGEMVSETLFNMTDQERANAEASDRYIREHRSNWLRPAPTPAPPSPANDVRIEQNNTTNIHGMGDTAGRLARLNERTQAQLLRSSQVYLS